MQNINKNFLALSGKESHGTEEEKLLWEAPEKQPKGLVNLSTSWKPKGGINAQRTVWKYVLWRDKDCFCTV